MIYDSKFRECSNEDIENLQCRRTKNFKARFSTYRYIIAILSRNVILPLCLGPAPVPVRPFRILDISFPHPPLTISSHVTFISAFLVSNKGRGFEQFSIMRLQSRRKGLCMYPSIFKKKYISAENIYCLHFKLAPLISILISHR